MVIRFCTLSILFGILLVSPVLAQTDSIRVRVFDANGEDLLASNRKTVPDDKNYVNFNPYLLARGAFVIGYEYVLHPKHSFIVEAGLTYRDFIFEAAHNDNIDFGTGKVNLGHYIAANYKFYPKDYNDFDEGFYISPGFISRQYNLSHEVEYYDGNEYRIQEVDASYSFTDYSFKMGIVRESWWIDDLITDVYFGVGSRTRVFNEYEIVPNDAASGDHVVVTETTEKIPALYFGVRIGFTF